VLETLEVDPLLTQAPAEGFVKPHVASGDHSSGLGVVDQVSICVSGIADQNAMKGGVCHLASLVSWDVDVRWAAEDPEMAQVRCVAVGQCHRDPVDATVVDAVVDVAGCQHGKLPVT
jgi:hypothetical protein